MTQERRRGELPPAYDPHAVEKPLYRWWEEQGFFRPEVDPNREPFAIMMPPPNVTGELHLGHALTDTLEDILTRWHRMRGHSALWLPGSDHAGIATQYIVEKFLREKEEIDRVDLGREKFVERTWEWVRKYQSSIREQHRRLGASCDWSREAFTLDEPRSKAVRTTFVNLFNKGLIYRGERMVNWCPSCQTVLSDLEVEYAELDSFFWHIRYKYEDGSGYLVVATTRPETLLGDTAVAVNPNDERYKRLVSTNVILPVLGHKIPVIGDGYVDQAFGTGALKITPAHDPNDYEVAQRWDLPLVNIFNDDATVNDNGGPYKGMDRFEARERIVEQLAREGLLEKIEPHTHSVGHCYRCRTVVEPKVSAQWFVKMQPLAKPAIEAVQDGRIQIVPDRFVRVYMNWMENIRDWCISRQLWWGHRIPVWYCKDCGNMTVAINDPATCATCSSPRIEQDPDVLEAWFSSGLWPHSTLGWPEETPELKYFYPNAVLETGYDILFFWVARMIVLGMENMGDVPFRHVYLHGLIRDEERQKMSKTKGNVINPLDAIAQYGADALRMSLTIATTPGNDIALGSSRMEAGRNFANKLWNASRFVLKMVDESGMDAAALGNASAPAHREDRWIWSRLTRLTQTVDRLLTDFQLGQAEQEIRDFIWDELCDWYIELAKVRIRDGSGPSPLPHLIGVLEASLRLLHPFMPFITEEVWQRLVERVPSLSRDRTSIMISAYPQANGALLDDQAEGEMRDVVSTVRAIRNVRVEVGVEANRWVEAAARASVSTVALQEEAAAIRQLARAEPFRVLGEEDPGPDPQSSMTAVLDRVTVVLPLAGLVDVKAERTRLGKDLDETRKRIAGLQQRLGSDAFRSKAPALVVQKEEEKLTEAQEKVVRLEEQLAKLGG